MLWNVYFRKGTVLIPTVAKTEAGFYLDINPVDAVHVTDAQAIRSAITRAVSTGNPTIPTPTRAAFPKPVVLSYVNVKSWYAFEREAECWEIVIEKDVYQIKTMRKSSSKGWEDDPEILETIPAKNGVEVVAQRVCELLQSASSRSTAHTKKKVFPSSEISK